MRDKIKKSLAKTLTLKLALVLLVALLVLATGAYMVVYYIVHEDNSTYNRFIAQTYLDTMLHYTPEDEEALLPAYVKEATYLGRYFCENKLIDYAYSYIASEDQKHILLLNISEREVIGYAEPTEDELDGVESNYIPNEEEIALWNGKTDHVSLENHFLDESIESLYAKDDAFGNRLVVGIGLSYAAIDRNIRRDFRPIIILILITLVLLSVMIYLNLRRSVLNPAKKISNAMSQFIRDGQRFPVKLDEKGQDEFAMIAASFNEMVKDLDSYMENIQQLNTAQERQKTELDIASRIQQGFLAPHAFYNQNCEIFAMMTPAKNVGGDLYDYFVLKDGRILLAVGDVSGKGIGASMFMAVILVMMKQFALAGKSPAEIFEEINRIILDRNDNLYFITAFIGIYDPKDGKLTYSNAGHNPPYILRNKPELLTDGRNLVLGLYDDDPYTEETTYLNSGDILFLYTDGLTEAVDANKMFFGDERLKAVLDGFRPSHEENIVQFVHGALKDFMKDSEQFDDITMLSFTVKKRTVLELSPDKKDFNRIKQVILDSPLSRSLQLSLCVAAEEIYINICSYAFEGMSSDGEKKIWFTFEHSDRMLMRFEDNGRKYDPRDGVQFDIDYDPDTQLGGLGKIIAFTIADNVSYEYKNEKNTLTITKYIMEVS